MIISASLLLCGVGHVYCFALDMLALVCYLRAHARARGNDKV